ncbi:hypothetical protein Peur_047147 [Populus x canadensis]
MCSHLWGWILLLRHQGFCSSNTCYQLTISPSSQLILQSSHQLTSSTVLQFDSDRMQVLQPYLGCKTEVSHELTHLVSS